jgi:hypothetical protein
MIMHGIGEKTTTGGAEKSGIIIMVVAHAIATPSCTLVTIISKQPLSAAPTV